MENRNPHGFLPDNTLDPVGGWKSKANAENNFLWDYELQRTKLFFGVTSNPCQDGAVQQSMGAIYDRSKEHLGTADSMIIQMRRRLLDAARQRDRTFQVQHVTMRVVSRSLREHVRPITGHKQHTFRTVGEV